MPSFDYALLLAVVNPLLAVFFWAIVFLLGGRQIPKRDVRWRVSSEGVAIHIAAFCTVNTFIRTFGIISVPSYLISLWALAIYLHVGISLFTMALVLRRYPTPDGLEIPKDWRCNDN